MGFGYVGVVGVVNVVVVVVVAVHSNNNYFNIHFHGCRREDPTTSSWPARVYQSIYVFIYIRTDGTTTSGVVTGRNCVLLTARSFLSAVRISSSPSPRESSSSYRPSYPPAPAVTPVSAFLSGRTARSLSLLLLFYASSRRYETISGRVHTFDIKIVQTSRERRFT